MILVLLNTNDPGSQSAATWVSYVTVIGTLYLPLLSYGSLWGGRFFEDDASSKTLFDGSDLPSSRPFSSFEICTVWEIVL